MGIQHVWGIRTPAPSPLGWDDCELCVPYCFLEFPCRLKLQLPTVVAGLITHPIGCFHRLNVCVLPKMYMLKPNPQCDDIWRWGLEEVIRS